MSAVWRVEFAPAAARELRKLGAEPQRQILTYLRNRIAGPDDPRRFGKPLLGDKAGLWRYRVGDFRILAEIHDGRVTVLVLAVGHRRHVYE